ncbi:hypothetical protein V1527DRAFT_454983 [Lipomyces starkeyi]
MHLLVSPPAASPLSKRDRQTDPPPLSSPWDLFAPTPNSQMLAFHQSRQAEYDLVDPYVKLPNVAAVKRVPSDGGPKKPKQ